MSARLCPHHQTPLKEHTVSNVKVDVCFSCKGVFLDRDELGKVAPGFHAADMRAIGRKGNLETERLSCPNCKKRMLKMRYGSAKSGLEVDRCVSCGGFWLDGGEFEKLLELASAVRNIGQKEILKTESSFFSTKPDISHAGWSPEAVVSLLAGIPVELDRRCSIFPLVTYGLIAANAVVFFLINVFGDLSSVIEAWGFTPADILKGKALHTFITSLFLHAGIAHLVGNMYFLYVFGDNVEAKTGSKYFLPYYLALGIGATLVSLIAGIHDPQIPHLGASGAISGIMATYIVFRPNAKFVMTLFLIYPFEISIWIYVGIWILFQALVLSTGTQTTTDIPAHIGGFALGLLGGFLFKKKQCA